MEQQAPKQESTDILPQTCRDMSWRLPRDDRGGWSRPENSLKTLATLRAQAGWLKWGRLKHATTDDRKGARRINNIGCRHGVPERLASALAEPDHRRYQVVDG